MNTNLTNTLLAPQASPRLGYLDAVRAFALLLGIVFHAGLSFMPFFIGWAVMDISTSPLISVFMHVSHSFRMEIFFLIAGFFGHLTFHRKGGQSFLKSRFVRIAIPFLVGWLILHPLIVSGWAMGQASLRGDVDIMAGLKIGIQSLETLPAGIFVGSHLWFLYYLLLITVLFLSVRALLALAGPRFAACSEKLDTVLRWLLQSRFTIVLLAIPTAAIVWFMGYWGVDTPDKTLVPYFPTLALYGGFFAFGWLLHRQERLLEEFARLSWGLWILLAIGVVASLMLLEMESERGHPQYYLAKAGFVVSYAVMMWSLVVLTLGIFRKLCRKENAAIRYLADASYWLYLVHLPLVIWLQIAVAELPYHWSLKLFAVSVATLLVSLLTYDLLVRSTFVGAILNGRRRSRVLWANPGVAGAAHFGLAGGMGQGSDSQVESSR